jgi:hypothetical protein
MRIFAQWLCDSIYSGKVAPAREPGNAHSIIEVIVENGQGMGNEIARQWTGDAPVGLPFCPVADRF